MIPRAVFAPLPFPKIKVAVILTAVARLTAHASPQHGPLCVVTRAQTFLVARIDPTIHVVVNAIAALEGTSFARGHITSERVTPVLRDHDPAIADHNRSVTGHVPAVAVTRIHVRAAIAGPATGHGVIAAATTVNAQPYGQQSASNPRSRAHISTPVNPEDTGLGVRRATHTRNYTVDDGCVIGFSFGDRAEVQRLPA